MEIQQFARLLFALALLVLTFPARSLSSVRPRSFPQLPAPLARPPAPRPPARPSAPRASRSPQLPVPPTRPSAPHAPRSPISFAPRQIRGTEKTRTGHQAPGTRTEGRMGRVEETEEGGMKRSVWRGGAGGCERDGGVGRRRKRQSDGRRRIASSGVEGGEGAGGAEGTGGRRRRGAGGGGRRRRNMTKPDLL